MTLRNFFSIVAIFLFSQSVFSQINYGIKFGMNYSEVKVHNDFTEIEVANYNGFKYGFHIGAIAKVDISEKLSVNAEFLYSDKGSSNNRGNDTSYYEFNLYYLDFPITANYKLTQNLYLQLGIEPGYLTSTNYDDYFEEPGFKYNSFDLEGILGIEYFIRKVGIGLRYEQSVIPIYDKTFKDPKGNLTGTTKSYNKNIQVYFTYLLKS